MHLTRGWSPKFYHHLAESWPPGTPKCQIFSTLFDITHPRFAQFVPHAHYYIRVALWQYCLKYQQLPLLEERNCCHLPNGVWIFAATAAIIRGLFQKTTR